MRISIDSYKMLSKHDYSRAKWYNHAVLRYMLNTYMNIYLNHVFAGNQDYLAAMKAEISI